MKKNIRVLAFLSLALVAFVGFVSTTYAEDSVYLIDDTFSNDDGQLEITGIIDYEGTKYYVVNGEIQKNYTGVLKYENKCYYIENGKVSNFTGIKIDSKKVIDGTNSWFYFEKGVYTTNTTIATNAYGTWYVKNGKVLQNDSINGFYKVNNKWYYCKNSKVQTGTSAIVYGKINNIKAWWYINNKGVFETKTTVATNTYGLWYVKDGRVIHDGSVNGFYKANSKWYYCKNAKVQTSTTTIVKGTIDKVTAWWYVEKGVFTNKNLLIKYSVNNVTYLVKNGKVDFSYTGFFKSGSYWWYVKDGRVKVKLTNVIKGTINGENAYWYVKAGKVTFTNAYVKRIENGRTYVVKNGKIDFTVNGLVKKDSNSYYYIINGRVFDSYTGIANGTIGKKKSTYYLKKGKLQTGYYGLVYYKEKYYYFREGVINKTYDGFAEELNSKKWYYIVDGQPTESLANRITSSLFVVVDCDNQKVCLVKKGKTVYSALCVTGKVSAGNMTPRGLFKIYSKEKNRDLKGANYVSHVKYWMPFKDNVGLHDASWRSKFGSNIYLNSGSHGCVNLPSVAAKYIYSKVKVGTKVLVFGGKQSVK